MRILLAISALALVAVLWATISIGRHIYKARRRARFLRERRPQSWAEPIPASRPEIPLGHRPPTAAELSYAELARQTLIKPAAAPPPPVAVPQRRIVPTPPVPASAPVSSTGRPAATVSSSAGALDLIAAARKISQDMPLPQVRSSALSPAFNPLAMAQTAPFASAQAPSALPPEVIVQPPSIESLLPPPSPDTSEQPATEFSRLAASLEQPLKKQPQAAKPPAEKAPDAPAAPDTFLRRPVRSVHLSHPAPPFSLPLRRPDWVYFNKDMGDLSDPTPSRIRDRVRSR